MNDDPAVLRIRLVGGLALEVDGQAVPAPPGRPPRLLLAWLALHPGLHARSRVAGRLWPDVREDSARASLRSALSGARRALGPGAGHIVSTRDRVGLGPPDGVAVDVHVAAALAGAGRHADALALLGGDLLPGLDADWIHDAREEHRAARARGLAALAGEAESAGDLAGAIARARELVAIDVLAEGSHRALIRLLALAGDRAAARAAYDRLRDLLRDRLGVSPTPETRRLLEPSPVPVAGPPAEPRTVPLPAPLRRRPRGALVGRTREMERLRAGWAEACGGGGRRVLLLLGEAGVGKTRLAAELARHAHGRGATVLLGRAREEAAVPHGPVAEALRPWLAERPAAELGPLAGELARLVPDLAHRLPRPLDGDPEGARLRLARATADALAAVCGAGPALLVLDDVQWLDGASGSLLGHALEAVPDAPLMVVGTCREGPVSAGLDGAMAELRAEGAVATVRVGAVDEAATAAMLDAWAGPGAPPALVAALHARTGGNPFFAEETLRHLEETGAIGAGRWPAPGDLGLPAGVREAVARRLARLGDDERWMLRLAAVAGSTIGVEALEAGARAAGAAGAAPVAPGCALEALERATDARLTRETGDGTFEFCHALVRETLLAELSGARRARLHLALGEALDDGAGGAPPMAAFHLAAAGDEADPGRAADTACTAAEQAAAQAAYEQAAQHLERALALPGVGDARRGDLLVRLGQARMRAGDRTAARAAFDQAAGIGRALGDGVLFGRAALGAGGLGVVVTGEDPARSGLLREALARLGDDDPALRSRLQSRLAAEVHYSGDERLTLSAGALGLARASADPEALLDALLARRIALWDPDHLRERTAASRELIARASEIGDRERVLQGHHWLVVDLLEAFDLAGAEEQIAAHQRLAAELCLPAYGWYGPIWRGLIATMRGEVAEGARLAAEGAAEGAAAGDGNAALFLMMNRVTAMAMTGRIAEEDLPELERRVATSPVSIAYRSMLSWVLAARGEHDAARPHLAMVACDRFAALPRDVNWMSAVHEAAEAAMLLDDVGVMRDAHGLFAPFAGRLVVSGRASASWGPVDLVLGRLALRLGRGDEARRRLASARDACDAAGLAPFSAAARAALA